MEEQTTEIKKKRTIRTKEERVAEIDKLISKHESQIKFLKAQKEAILHPPKHTNKRIGMNTVMNKVKELGMSPEEALKKLGISLDR